MNQSSARGLAIALRFAAFSGAMPVRMRRTGTSIFLPVSVAGISGTSTPTGNLRGILVAVPTGATEIDVTLPMPEPDRAYAVTVTPSWPVGVGVSARGTAGFTVRFGGPAPEGATLDWVLVR